MKKEILDRKHIYLFWKLVVASFVYVLPIILADRYYNDDLARTLRGATGWKGDGRPMGEYLILLLCGGRPIVDLAPLLLILSVVILSFSLTLYAKENFKSFECDNIKILVLLFIITNPFAMSNLSYKFDCIIMFTALSIAFLVYALSSGSSFVRIFLCAVIAGMLIMSFYQPAIGMCVVLFITAIFFDVLDGEKRMCGEFVRLIGLILGAVIYKVMVAPQFISSEDWRYEASKVVFDVSADSIITVKDNIENAFYYIGNYVKGISLLNKIVLLIMIVLSLITAVTKYIFTSKRNRIRKVLDSVFIVVSPIMVFAGTFLPLAVLASVNMRSRIFISFGGFLFFIGVLLMHLAKKNKAVVTLLLLLSISFQYIYMYAYGNALKSQKEYEKYLVYNIANDLETISVSDDIEKVTFDGNAPRCRQVQMMCEKYPFFQEIVPVYFNNDTWIGGAWVYHYLQEDLKIDYLTDEDMAVIDSKEPVIENLRYSCYVNGKRAIVQFRKD